VDSSLLVYALRKIKFSCNKTLGTGKEDICYAQLFNVLFEGSYQPNYGPNFLFIFFFGTITTKVPSPLSLKKKYLQK
jgi:hypothetical protein